MLCLLCNDISYCICIIKQYETENQKLDADVIIYCTVALLLISQQFVSLHHLLPLTSPDHPHDADDEDQQDGGPLQTGDDQTAVPPAQPVREAV